MLKQNSFSNHTVARTGRKASDRVEILKPAGTQEIRAKIRENRARSRELGDRPMPMSAIESALGHSLSNEIQMEDILHGADINKICNSVCLATVTTDCGASYTQVSSFGRDDSGLMFVKLPLANYDGEPERITVEQCAYSAFLFYDLIVICSDIVNDHGVDYRAICATVESPNESKYCCEADYPSSASEEYYRYRRARRTKYNEVVL